MMTADSGQHGTLPAHADQASLSAPSSGNSVKVADGGRVVSRPFRTVGSLLLLLGTLGLAVSGSVGLLHTTHVFSIVTVKVGWATAALADLKIDSSWAWVLAAALGGKAAQSLAENSTPK
jgi:hypothetical protein